MKYFILYCCILSLIGFCSMGIDKRKAKKKQYRISEKMLLFIAIFGGSIGSILGMKVFHHKTLHYKFKFGLPLILLLQVLCFFIITQKMMGNL